MTRKATSLILLSLLLCFAPSLATVVSQNLGSFVYTIGERLDIPLGDYFSGPNLNFSLNGTTKNVSLVNAGVSTVNTSTYNTTAFVSTPVSGDYNGGIFAMVGTDFNLYTSRVAADGSQVNFTVTSLSNQNYNNTLGYICSDVLVTNTNYVVGCTNPNTTSSQFTDLLIFVDFTTLIPTYFPLAAIPLVKGTAAASLVLKDYKIGLQKLAIGYHVGSATLYLINISNKTANAVTVPAVKAISSVDAASGLIYISGDGIGVYQVGTDGAQLVGNATLISTNALKAPVSTSKTLFGLPYFAIAAQNESFILANQATTDAFVLPWGNDTAILNDLAFDDSYLYLVASRNDSSAQFLYVYERGVQGVVANSLIKKDITTLGNLHFLGIYYGEDGGDVVLIYTDKIVFLDANYASLKVFSPVNQTQITVTANGTDGKSVSSTVTLIPRAVNDQTVLKTGAGNLVGNNGLLNLDVIQDQFNGPFLRVASQGQIMPNITGGKLFANLSQDKNAYSQIYAKFAVRQDLGYANNEVLSDEEYTSPVKVFGVTGATITYETGFIDNTTLYNAGSASNKPGIVNLSIANTYTFTTIGKCVTGTKVDACIVDGHLGVFNENNYDTDATVTCNDIYLLAGQFYPAERAICIADGAINVYNANNNQDPTNPEPKLTLVYTMTPAQLGLINFTNVTVTAHPNQNQILFVGYPGGFMAVKAPLFQTDTVTNNYNPMVLYSTMIAAQNYKLVAGPNSVLIVNLAGNAIQEFDVTDVNNAYARKNWNLMGATLLASSAIQYEVALNQLFVAVNNTDNTQSILVLQPGNTANAYLLARINVTNVGLNNFTTATDINGGYALILTSSGVKQTLSYYARPQTVNLGVNGLTANQVCLYCSVKSGLSVTGPTNNYANFTYTNIAAEKPINLITSATIGFNIANNVFTNSPSKMFSGNPLDYNVTLDFALGINDNPFKFFNYLLPLNYSSSITNAKLNNTNNQWMDTFNNKTHGFILLNDSMLVYNLTNASLVTEESYPVNSHCISGEVDDHSLNVVLFCLDLNGVNWFFYEVYSGTKVPVSSIPYKYKVVTPVAKNNFFIFTLGSNQECPISVIEVNSTSLQQSQFCPTDSFEFGISPLYFNAELFDVAYDYDTTIGSFVVFVGDNQGNMASFIIIDSDNVQPFGLNNNFLSLIQSDIPPAQLQVQDLKVINVNTAAGVTSGQVVVIIKNFHSYSVSFSSGAENIISLTGVQYAFVAVPETPSTGSYAISGSFFFDVKATPDFSNFYLVSYPFTNLAQTGPAKYKYIAPIQRVVMNTNIPPAGFQFPLAINGTGMPANVMVTVATGTGNNFNASIQVYTAQDSIKVTASNAPTTFADLQGKNPSLSVQVANEVSFKAVGFNLNYTGAGRLGVALSGIFAILGAVFFGLMF